MHYFDQSDIMHIVNYYLENLKVPEEKYDAHYESTHVPSPKNPVVIDGMTHESKIHAIAYYRSKNMWSLLEARNYVNDYLYRNG